MFCIFQGLFQKSIKEGLKCIIITKRNREGNIIIKTLEVSGTHPKRPGPAPYHGGAAQRQGRAAGASRLGFGPALCSLLPPPLRSHLGPMCKSV
jgi:hypothetical protein